MLEIGLRAVVLTKLTMNDAQIIQATSGTNPIPNLLAKLQRFLEMVGCLGIHILVEETVAKDPECNSFLLLSSNLLEIFKRAFEMALSLVELVLIA